MTRSPAPRPGPSSPLPSQPGRGAPWLRVSVHVHDDLDVASTVQAAHEAAGHLARRVGQDVGWRVEFVGDAVSGVAAASSPAPGPDDGGEGGAEVTRLAGGGAVVDGLLLSPAEAAHL